MKNSFPLGILLALCFHQGHSQTGPGGIGNATNNSLWLKANAGTSSTTSGTSISSWNDMSGNANHVSQATTNQRPTYVANVMNGFPAILFDNSSANNDYLSGADASNLDNTTGLTIFTVTRMNNLGDARSIIAKRTNVGVNQAYMFFYYTSNYVNIDIESNNDRWTTTPTTFSTNTNYLLDLYYNGSIPNPRARVYSAGTLIKSGNESATSLIDYNSPLLIGTTHIGDTRPFGGYIAEIILYREALNDACRIIVDNYLAAKYAIALSANDYYAGDTPANGDFDFEVAGIGQSAAGSTNNAFAPEASGGMGITYVSGFNDGDYILAGHKLHINNTISTDIAVTTGGPIDVRWERIWYIDVTNTSTSITADVVFDLGDGGFPGAMAGPASNYKLLYRAVNSGAWTIVATASSVSGDLITFANYSFTGNANDGYYTIGTLNHAISPLPVQLVTFDAKLNGYVVDLCWTTATETNNAYFTIQRSADALNWTDILEQDGAGTCNIYNTYKATDSHPLRGLSYYRLRQTDYDGKRTYSEIRVVSNNHSAGEMVIFPNPSDGDGFGLELLGFAGQEVRIVVCDAQGRIYYDRRHMIGPGDQSECIVPQNRLNTGIYLVTVTGSSQSTGKLMVR